MVAREGYGTGKPIGTSGPGRALGWSGLYATIYSNGGKEWCGRRPDAYSTSIRVTKSNNSGGSAAHTRVAELPTRVSICYGELFNTTQIEALTGSFVLLFEDLSSRLWHWCGAAVCWHGGGNRGVGKDGEAGTLRVTCTRERALLRHPMQASTPP
jgi:hypothetical protein